MEIDQVESHGFGSLERDRMEYELLYGHVYLCLPRALTTTQKLTSL